MCLNMQICSILCSVIAGEDRNGKTENGKRTSNTAYESAGRRRQFILRPARANRAPSSSDVAVGIVRFSPIPSSSCVCVSVCSDRELDWCNKIRCIIYTYTLHTLALHLVASSRISDRCKKRLWDARAMQMTFTWLLSGCRGCRCCRCCCCCYCRRCNLVDVIIAWCSSNLRSTARPPT